MVPRSCFHKRILASVPGAGLTSPSSSLPPSTRQRLRPGAIQELMLAMALPYLGLALHQHDAGDDGGL